MNIAREPLITMLSNLPHHDFCELFEIIDLCRGVLEFESKNEELLFEQFSTSFWIGTKER